MRLRIASLFLTVPALSSQIHAQTQPVAPAGFSPESRTLMIPKSGNPLLIPNGSNPQSEPNRLPQNLIPNVPQRGMPQATSPQQAIPASPQHPMNPAQGPSEIPNRGNPTVKLPQPENKIHLEAGSIISRRYLENTQIWSGSKLLKDLGRNAAASEEVLKILRELRPTDWVTIGRDRPIVEYGLTNGEPFAPTYGPAVSMPIDLKSIRVEGMRGVWVLRDDQNILLNFGLNQADAEQAAAVVLRYGFNRMGSVVQPNPVFTYFYLQSGQMPGSTATVPNNPLAQLQSSQQEKNLGRTGIEVPGVGFVGERVVIDPRKVEYRKDRSEWVVASGNEIIAKFGASEWSAREAQRLIQECRFTEYCRFNSEISFFLVNGQAPTRVPLSVQASRYDVDGLKIRPASAGAWGLYDTTGKQVFTVSSETEAKNLVKLLQHYRFDQTCQLGLSSRTSLKFLAKAGR